ncbi:T9SS type A sorting domain-containing protein [Aquimarina sp. RZ0]|uniref:T9SS type A sorting domain-containing protein n=1 Tax=Aquimarina sp. RZ0 TaxID=2607730 RepID=UPI0011F1E1DE|nr:T9SS type A sorting domain-containing protein [Aquimarina sp. RZ0]KAA1247689.1 T9SS type A sorting domain-containing protein [Aquimarina sp. RZ0]
MRKISNYIRNAIIIASIFLCANMNLMGQEKNNVLSKEVIKQKRLDYINFYKQKQRNKKTEKSSSNSMPYGVNPFTSYHSKNKGDTGEWRKHLQKKSISLHKNSNRKNNPVVIDEIENDNQSINNTLDTAQEIPNFGSGESNTNNIIINGSSGVRDEDVDFVAEEVASNPEDNGSIPLAQFITFDPNTPEDVQIIYLSDTIGNGPHGASGSGTGDIDMYAIILEKDQIIRIFLQTFGDPAISTMTPVILVYNENGGIITGKGPEFITRENIIVTQLQFKSPETGIYYFAISSAAQQLEDPFDSSSGETFPPGEPLGEGIYTVQFENYGVLDSDHYAMNLKKGDVLGASVINELVLNPGISLLSPDGSIEISTNTFNNFSNAPETPISSDGRSNFSYIAPQDGNYILRIDQTIGDYTTEIVAARPGYETNNKGLKQFIYLDFTGVDDFNQRDFFRENDSIPDEELDKIRTLSPFKDFLENWGIENTKYNLLKMAFNITEVAKENTVKESRLSTINPDFTPIILSDYGSEFLGKKIPEILESLKIPYSRVIIGGTIEESGFDTIGIADDIDVGNFDFENDALVLLDVLSSTNTDDQGSSVNFIPLADGVTIEDVMPVAVGNIVAHEFGHYLGNFHCNSFNDQLTLMDEGGGGISTAVGIFPDRGEKFGDANTRDIDFTVDQHSTLEGILGVNHTDVNTAFAMGFTPGNRSEGIDTPKEIEQLEKNALKELFNQIDNLDAFAYPNPQNHQETSHLVFSSKKSGQVYVDLYDLQGRKIDQLFTGTIEKGEKMQLELVPSKYNLSSGVYIYNIKTPGQEINYKFSIK